jgi:hypothetical protein
MQSAKSAEILRAKNALRMTRLEDDDAHNAMSAEIELVTNS